MAAATAARRLAAIVTADMADYSRLMAYFVLQDVKSRVLTRGLEPSRRRRPRDMNAPIRTLLVRGVRGQANVRHQIF